MTLLAADLKNFKGSETFTRHPLMRSVLLTEGAMYVAEHGEAHWLMDKIATNQAEPKFKEHHDFQVWKLELGEEGRSTLRAEDGNYHLIHSESIRTEFPLASFKLYCVDGVIMLPGEY